MARYERVAEIVGHLTDASTPLSLDYLCEALHASSATVKRLVRFMREELEIPVVFDRAAGGYRIQVRPAGAAPASPAPGGATRASDEALLARAGAQVLAQFAPALFAPPPPSANAARHRGGAPRLRLVLPEAPPVRADTLRVVVLALKGRRRIRVQVRAAESGPRLECVLSPLRLTWDRGTWRLASWSHDEERLRVDPVHRIDFAAATALPAQVLDDAGLDAALAAL